MILFKYLNAEGTRRVLESPDRCSLKFALPSTYNDPYELFLQPTKALGDEGRAFFQFYLRQILQTPVTCFSGRPNSIPMWAHYARDGSGACVGFDAEAIADQFTEAYLADVEYSNEPAQIDSETIAFAAGTMKRRHSLIMLAQANRAAYFVKRDEWEYECERRLVVLRSEMEEHDGVLLKRVPDTVLRFLIVSKKTHADVRALCEKRAAQAGVPLLQVRFGRTVYDPFFVDAQDRVFKWAGTDFEECDEVCSECQEPGSGLDENGMCQWCGVSEAAIQGGPRLSGLALALEYGIDRGIPFHFAGLRPVGRLVKEHEAKEEKPDSEPTVQASHKPELP